MQEVRTTTCVMEYPLFGWLVSPCGLQQDDAQQLAQKLYEDHRILTVDSFSNVLRSHPTFLADVHCPLAYALTISSHLYVLPMKSLDTINAIEIFMACTNLGFTDEFIQKLKNRGVSGYILSSLPLEAIIYNHCDESSQREFDNFQRIVDRWKREGVPSLLFVGIEQHSTNNKKRKLTEDMFTTEEANEITIKVVKPTVIEPIVPSDAPTLSNEAVNEPSERTVGPPLSANKQETVVDSDVDLTTPPEAATAIKESLGGVSSSESTLSIAATKPVSGVIEQHSIAILKHKEQLHSSEISEQQKGAKYFVCLSTTNKGYLKLLLEHKCVESLCEASSPVIGQMLNLYTLSAINNIFSMDKERTTITEILVDKEKMCPVLIKKLAEVHSFDFYTAIIWCLQNLVLSAERRGAIVELNVIPLVIKVFQKTQDSDVALRVQILIFASNLLQAPLLPLDAVRSLLRDIVAPCIDSQKCAHPALTALYFFTHHPPESVHRELYLAEVFDSAPLLQSVMVHAMNTSQVKISQVARRVIENLSSSSVKANVEKLLDLNVAEVVGAQLLSLKHPTVLVAMTTIRNLSAVSPQVVQSFLSAGVYTVVCRTYGRVMRRDIAVAANQCMRQAMVGATGKQIEALVSEGLLPVLCDLLLDVKDIESVEIALTSLFLLLHKCPSAQAYDDVIRQVYELDGWKAVDRCRLHEDVRVRDKAERMNIVGIRAQHWK